MERKNHRSSLPSNYVTLAQLHERWLKQHDNNQNNNQFESQEEEKNQEQDQQSPKHNHAPSNQSASKSPPKKQEQYVVRIRTDPETKRLTAAVEPVAEIADGKGKASKSNKKIRKVIWKIKTENREGSGEGSGTTEKGTIEGEVNEVEERVRVLSINSGNGKQKGRLGKTNNGFRNFGQKKKVWVRKDEI